MNEESMRVKEGACGGDNDRLDTNDEHPDN